MITFCRRCVSSLSTNNSGGVLDVRLYKTLVKPVLCCLNPNTNDITNAMYN